MDEQAIFQRADDVEEILFGKRIALYRSGGERVMILNKTGSLLWKRLETPHNRRELVEFLQSQFPRIPEAQLENDVASFLQELRAAACIDISNAAA